MIPVSFWCNGFLCQWLQSCQSQLHSWKSMQICNVGTFSTFLVPNDLQMKSGSVRKFVLKRTSCTVLPEVIMHIGCQFHKVEAWEVHEVCPCFHLRRNEQSTSWNRDKTYGITCSSITASPVLLIAFVFVSIAFYYSTLSETLKETHWAE